MDDLQTLFPDAAISILTTDGVMTDEEIRDNKAAIDALKAYPFTKPK